MNLLLNNILPPLSYNKLIIADTFGVIWVFFFFFTFSQDLDWRWTNKDKNIWNWSKSECYWKADKLKSNKQWKEKWKTQTGKLVSEPESALLTKSVYTCHSLAAKLTVWSEEADPWATRKETKQNLSVTKTSHLLRLTKNVQNKRQRWN